MKIVTTSFEIIHLEDGEQILRRIESAGRTCYKSEAKITPSSSRDFVRKIIERGHHSVIEHASCTVRIVCDRGISHEIVRHRLASYSQESTRYANYANDRFGSEITVIKPYFWNENSPEYKIWLESMLQAEKAYLELIAKGASPQQARSVLPNSLKTEVVATCNLREWRHIMTLRCAPSAHPQMREIMIPLLAELRARVPVIFDDICETFSDALAKHAKQESTPMETA